MPPNSQSSMSDPNPNPSSFLHPPLLTTPSPTPAIIHLRRDQLLPLPLNPAQSSPNETLNTRFGHFPHRTLLGVPYGSQIKASNAANVRKDKGGNQRKRKRDGPDAGVVDDGKEQEEGTPATNGNSSAPSGFIHLLAPTPELWTQSLPHRTQVVYTPDSSYILHRLQARPGTHIIEAGAGSGSFTHAAVRSVYNGYPGETQEVSEPGSLNGKVFSFEYHEERARKLTAEIESHGLKGLVQITHGDVCKEGFILKKKKKKGSGGVSDAEEESSNKDLSEKMDIDTEGIGAAEERLSQEEPDITTSPEATAVFLDLPAPWLALPHLTRNHQPPLAPLPIPSLNTPTPNTTTPSSPSLPDTSPSPPTTYGPLHPTLPIQICTFSPCIEQIHRTATLLRKLSWTSLDMVEISHHKLEVRRHASTSTINGDGTSPNIADALARLKGIVRWRVHPDHLTPRDPGTPRPTKDRNQQQQKTRDTQDDSPLPSVITTRLEPELKTHTSYLLFATLPPPWTDADEAVAAARVEVERERYLQDTEKTGHSTWKKEKEEKRRRGKYVGAAAPGGVGGLEVEGITEAGGGAEGEVGREKEKPLTRKERKRKEREERYGKNKRRDEVGLRAPAVDETETTAVVEAPALGTPPRKSGEGVEDEVVVKTRGGGGVRREIYDAANWW